MITIIHGDDVVASRKFLNEEKAKKKHVSFTENYSVTDIAQALEGSLFEENETVVFIENLLGRKKSKEKEEIITYITRQKINNIYMWEESIIPQKTLGIFTNINSKLFTLPKLLFSFLDTIAPNIGSKLILLFHRLTQQSDVDFVFAMIVRQFRLLLAISDKDSIDEVKRLAPWQVSKLSKQGSFFTNAQLLSIYQKLLAIETSLKTGTLSLSLTQAIDFFLLDL